MAKKVMDKPLCEACGADIRQGSMFCYNCGGPVTPEAKAQVDKAAAGAPSSVWLKDDLADLPRDTTKLTAPETASVAEEAPEEKRGIYEEAKLKTAASLRRKGKLIARRNVEVVWEEPDSSPDARFILAALVFVLVVIVLFFTANYLK